MLLYWCIALSFVCQLTIIVVSPASNALTYQLCFRIIIGWSVKTWIALAGLPAFLYTIQNVAALIAYQNLEALTFNVLNQTKILSAALSCYFVMGKRQSKMQVVSLCILILSTLVIEQILHPRALASLMSFGGGSAAAAGATTATGMF